MKVTPDDYGRRCQFDHFCKLVLYHEAVDYFRERKRQRGWETSFETLPLSELDTLCTIDQYPSDSFIFPAYGCELQISDGLVAAAFASLPQPGQSIFRSATGWWPLPLPLAVIEAARAGDAGAVEQVLQYYNGYINKLCKVQL